MPPTPIEVPDVVGQSRDEAVAALARADLEPKIVEVYSEKDTGTVTAQNPKGGEKRKVGDRVTIVVTVPREEPDPEPSGTTSPSPGTGGGLGNILPPPLGGGRIGG